MPGEDRRKATRPPPGSPADRAPERAQRPEERPPEEISLLQLFNILLRHRRVVLLAPLAVALLVVAVTLLLPRTYTATASFMPQVGEGQASRLAGLAAQFGVSVPTGEAGQTPRFYADLLRSRELLKQTALAEYRLNAAGGGQPLRGDLIALLEIEADTRPVAVELAVERLRGEHVSVSTDAETGVVELSVSTRWPALSRQVAERMLELVNRFNLETRQTQAAAERSFIQERLLEAQGELQEAEDSLQAFLQRNRRYENDPELAFQAERLQRRVGLRQQVFTSLSQSYEQARIDEVRNTPVITVVEPAELPARPDRRRLALKGILGLMLGGMLGVFWAFGREFASVAREEDPDDYAEFERLKAAAAAEVGGAWRRLRRPFGRDVAPPG